MPITKDILNSHVSSRVDNGFIGFFNVELGKQELGKQELSLGLLIYKYHK